MERWSVNLERCNIPGCKPLVHAGFRSLEAGAVHRQFVSLCISYQTNNKCYLKEKKYAYFALLKLLIHCKYILINFYKAMLVYVLNL